MPCGTAACVNEKLPKKSCAADSAKPVNEPNLEQLIAAARLLRPLLGELVFVGGTVTGLLITDEAASDPRPTLDLMWTPSPKSPPTRSMRRLATAACAGVPGRHQRRGAAVPVGSSGDDSRRDAAGREGSRVLQPLVSGCDEVSGYPKARG